MYGHYAIGLLPALLFFLYLVLGGLGIYIAILLIKALNIYIRKNS